MANRLAQEKSRYLLQHAENPVDWRPWGEEAFIEAKDSGKPVLLSIGYSSCHWCHVMAHESFENPEVADKINRLYVPIKVDKEEYPDVDGYYMSFLTRLSGAGGWPLNVLVNSHMAPFYGFTYLSPEALRGTLEYARTQYDEKEQMQDQRINTAFTQRRIESDAVRNHVEHLSLKLEKNGEGPRFPQGIYSAFLSKRGFDIHNELENLITKGLFDHIEGGWFRYTVDNEWKIPHFEKMLYDQAALLYLCSEAHALSPDLTTYAIEGCVHWLEEKMRLPNGLYGSATDADTPEGEGHYYTFDEIESQSEAELFRLSECGLHENRYLPWIAFDRYLEDPEGRKAIVEQRRDERSRFDKPGLDEKAVFSWNAFLGYALLRCYRATRNEELMQIAERLTKSLVVVAESSDTIPHVVYPDQNRRGSIYLQDYSSYLLLLASMPRGDDSEDRRIADHIDTIDRIFVSEEHIWHTDRRMFESQSLWQDTPFPAGGSILLNALVAIQARDSNISGIDKLLAALSTNIVEVASEHPEFFAYWLNGFHDFFRDAR